MPDDARPKRPKPISWRPPADKRAAIEDMAAKSGLSMNAFITEAVLGRSRHRPGELRLLAQILAACADIAGALKHSGQRPDDTQILEALHSDLAEIRSALFVLMGRKP